MWIYTDQKTEADARGSEGDQPSGAPWVRFGGETLLLADEAEATRAQGRQVDAARDELHVVVQNGRLFQQHNPDVPVIHDRGRFLLVKLDPARARELAAKHPTCYGVTPLAKNRSSSTKSRLRGRRERQFLSPRGRQPFQRESLETESYQARLLPHTPLDEYRLR